MGGGLMQLVITGHAMEQFILTNASINYYKYVYKKHTNFSMENHEITPINNGNNGLFRSATMTYEIKRHGDLLSNIFLSFKVPDIYSTNDFKFRWVNNLGFNYIHRVYFIISGQTIETIYGEWMNIWNELTNKDGTTYNKLIGNIPEYTDPVTTNPKVTIINNKIITVNYPATSILTDTIPSIKEREIQVPLHFWFTRNPSLALPLLKLANNEIKIVVETNLNAIEGLYTIWSEKLNTHVSSYLYNKINPNNKINIYNFIKYDGVLNTFDVNNKLHLTYVFLDNIERSRMLMDTNTINYVIDTVKKAIGDGSDGKYNITNANNHIKEYIWTIRRSDIINNFNNYINYTAQHTYNESMGILKKATISWINQTERVEYDANFYNQIQPYYNHTNIPRTGIYCYSFALFPEKINTSGSYNNSKITTSLQLELNDYTNNQSYTNMINSINSLTNSVEKITYDVSIFIKEINILSVINGQARLKYV